MTQSIKSYNIDNETYIFNNAIQKGWKKSQKIMQNWQYQVVLLFLEYFVEQASCC